MWNNYTVHTLNADKMATRQAEAKAQRLADEGHEHGELRSRAAARLGNVIAFATSRSARLRHAAGGKSAALPGPVRPPRPAAGHHGA
jgi:hypothetical protein